MVPTAAEGLDPLLPHPLELVVLLAVGLPLLVVLTVLVVLVVARRGPLAGGTEVRVAERLRELDRLRADGLVTPEEYATRRAGILDSV